MYISIPVTSVYAAQETAESGLDALNYVLYLVLAHDLPTSFLFSVDQLQEKYMYHIQLGIFPIPHTFFKITPITS